MKSSGRQYLFLVALIAGALIFAAPAMAAQVAKVSIFEGDVLIVRGDTSAKVTSTGVAVMAGDIIQTGQGMAQITFEDGAVMQVNEFTSASVQEREEETGYAFWKKLVPVRRITAFVGKLWFKSGASDRKNYVQTPTAVCGLRGTEVEFGAAQQQSFLNFVSGLGEIVKGSFVVGVFNNPGISAAQQSQLYNAIQAITAAQGADATAKIAEAFQLAQDTLVAIDNTPALGTPVIITSGGGPVTTSVAPRPTTTSIPTTSTTSVVTTTIVSP